MNLLVTGVLKYDRDFIEVFNKAGYKLYFHLDESETVANPEIYNAVICNNLFLNNDINKFRSLKYIQLTSAGLDRVPIEIIKRKNIKLFNAAGIYNTPISEWVILKILEIYKNSRFFYNNQNQCKWAKNRNIEELNGKKALILGCGNLGTAIAKKLKAFDVHVSGYDIVKSNASFFENIYTEGLENILPQFDINIICLPLTPDTKHMFNNKLIRLIKNSSILINISRGAIIKTEDLIKNISKFKGVALDVFETEPLQQDSLLWKFENVIITPHNSFVSDKNNERMKKLIYKNILGISE